MPTETPRTDDAWEAAIEEVSADGLWSAAATDMREIASKLERENELLRRYCGCLEDQLDEFGLKAAQRAAGFSMPNIRSQP